MRIFKFSKMNRKIAIRGVEMLSEGGEVGATCANQVSHDAESEAAVNDLIDGVDIKRPHGGRSQTDLALRTSRTPGTTAVNTKAIA